MFHVGQMVVCIDDELYVNGHPVPRGGAIYTISYINYEPGDSSFGLSLEEVPDPPATLAEWDLWDSVYFRPVAKTDISIFQSMLAPRQKELVHE